MPDRIEPHDLVDAATGDVVLAETDATLAGVLALVLRRAHRSSRPEGRWFGRAWTSSLDQRLLVAGERIYGRFADGTTLTWKIPGSAGDPPSLPVTGPAWPLLQSPDGSCTVSDPQHGLTWRFEQRPGQEDGELPLVSVTDRAGHEISYSYDADGRPASVVHSGGYRVLVTFTGERVSALTLAGGDGQDDIPLRRFDYDDAGDLAAVTDATGLPRRYSYDAAGRLTGWTDRNGRSRRYAFDADGRCVRVEGPGGILSATFAYEPGTTRRTTLDGAVTAYTVTEAGQIAAITDSMEKTSRTEHDDRGRLTAAVDPQGRATRYGYDERGTLVSVTDPAGRASRVDTDEAGLPVRITGPDGGTWLQGFDKNGNLTEVTAPDGSVLKHGYDSRGHLAEVTGADGAVTTFECDPAGLPVAVTKPAGGTTRYERDRLGRVVRVTGPDGGVTAYTWTTDGRPVSRTRADGSTESWIWDGEGNLLRQISATGSATSYTYGPLDELVAVAWPGGARSTLEYDESHHLTAVNHGGLRWRYEYDSAGRLIAQTDYNGATTQFWHDPAGQLYHRVNPSGREASFHFDALGNMVFRHNADGAEMTFEYDPAGRLVGAKNEDAELVFVRDALGRVVSESCNGRTVTKTYDAAGKVTGRVTPSGAATAWVYGAAGTPSALTADGRELRFGHDGSGREIRRELPGGTVLTQEWDRLGRLTAQALTGQARAAAGQPLQRRDYTYNPDGYVTGLDDLLTGDRRFHLDAAGHVTAVTSQDDGSFEQYGYDAAGSIVSALWPAASSGDGASEPSPQGSRELDRALILRAGDIRYRHDAAGRVISRTLTRASGESATWRYTWDADSRLYSAALPDGTKWQYLYDPLGRRIAKRHRSADGELLEQTLFAWDGEVLVEQEEIQGDSSTVTTWNHRNDSFVPLTQTSRSVGGEEFHALVTGVDGLPTELVSADGAVAGSQRYTLWGQPARTSGTATTPLRFPGHYHDQETGLHYDRHRYYDPETGAYLAPHFLGLTSGPNPHVHIPNSPAAGDPLAELEPAMSGADPAAWAGAADHWIGSLLTTPHHPPVPADVDGADPRLFAGSVWAVVEAARARAVAGRGPGRAGEVDLPELL